MYVLHTIVVNFAYNETRDQKTPDENTYFLYSQALVGAEKQVEVKKGVKILM